MVCRELQYIYLFGGKSNLDKNNQIDHNLMKMIHSAQWSEEQQLSFFVVLGAFITCLNRYFEK